MPGVRRAVALDGNPFAILGRQLRPATYQFATCTAKVGYRPVTAKALGPLRAESSLRWLPCTKRAQVCVIVDARI